jgi:GT2 family glycosyltransferase
MATGVTAVIPATNCAELTVRCVEHLVRYAAKELVKIIYVDNGSEVSERNRVDEALARSGFPYLVIHNSSNVGFSRAINQGIEASDGDVLILNNDCFVGPDCVRRLIRHLQSDASLAAVGPVTDGPGMHSIRRSNWPRRYVAALDALPDLARAAAEVASAVPVPSVEPAESLAFFCTLLSRHAIDQVGSLDEEFPCGLGADDEWCMRAEYLGLRSAYALDAFASHIGRQSFDRLGINRDELQKDAMRLLQAKVSRWTKPCKFNLIYHVAAFKSNDAWRRNVFQILKRMQVFNGKRVVGIVTGDELESPETVMQAFDGHNVEFIVRPNDRGLRETVTLPPLLGAVESIDPTEATFTLTRRV